MKISELQKLRIGHWIFDHEHIPRQIAYITDETIGLRLNPDSTIKYQENPILSGNIAELKPIPLTPNIFRACMDMRQKEIGKYEFICDCAHDGKIGFDTVTYHKITVTIWFNINQGGLHIPITTIKYLHELQDIISIINKKELEINLQES